MFSSQGNTTRAAIGVCLTAFQSNLILRNPTVIILLPQQSGRHWLLLWRQKTSLSQIISRLHTVSTKSVFRRAQSASDPSFTCPLVKKGRVCGCFSEACAVERSNPMIYYFIFMELGNLWETDQIESRNLDPPCLPKLKQYQRNMRRFTHFIALIG